MAAPQGHSGWMSILENPTVWGIKQGANLGKDLHIPGAGLISGAANTVTDTNHFLGALTNPNTWVRVGEVLVGLICLGVGVSIMTHTQNVATKVTKTAAKAAVL